MDFIPATIVVCIENALSPYCENGISAIVSTVVLKFFRFYSITAEMLLTRKTITLRGSRSGGLYRPSSRYYFTVLEISTETDPLT